MAYRFDDALLTIRFYTPSLFILSPGVIGGPSGCRSRWAINPATTLGMESGGSAGFSPLSMASVNARPAHRLGHRIEYAKSQEGVCSPSNYCQTHFRFERGALGVQHARCSKIRATAPIRQSSEFKTLFTVDAPVAIIGQLHTKCQSIHREARQWHNS